MDKVSLALQLILSLSILVVLHELGHYLPAKWFKTRVEKFYLFFDPYFSLFKKQIGETEWGIGWIPFGGYVKISGMIDESMDKEQMKQPPQPWEFRSKKAWQRLIIMVGGVTVNFVLGILLFGLITYHWGDNYLKTENAKYGMAVDSMGMRMGLQDGDLIIKVGDTPMEKFNSALVSSEIIINEAREVTVQRGEETITLQVSDELAQDLTKYENRNKQLFGPRAKLDILKVVEGSPASDAGYTRDMEILAVNGQNFGYAHKFPELIKGNAGKTIDLTVVKPTQDTINLPVKVSEAGTIGVQLGYKGLEFSTEKYGLLTSMAMGWDKSIYFLTSQLKAFGQIFSGKIKAKDSLGSVFSIAGMFDTGWDWRVFWTITASLSILLAFFNLLPIPALDGGYVLFLLWEMISGKAPGDKFMEVVNIIGFVLLIGLMVFALGLDISRFF